MGWLDCGLVVGAGRRWGVLGLGVAGPGSGPGDGGRSGRERIVLQWGLDGPVPGRSHGRGWAPGLGIIGYRHTLCAENFS